MAVMKCKMCGGDLEITEGSNIAVCEYCGTKQTVPTLDNERKTSLFGRAGRLLRACEFDKASVVFGDIVSEFPEEAEAYWGLLLCKYGVEYVDDPATGKKIPTCHRLSFESVMEDSDFEQACENADSSARSVYREEAKFLEELRRNVIEVSSKEEPYDVFICYKETDANGDRTIDSVMAQDVYDALTEKGLRVFFARITLEDKLGMEYEPYIFAALNSAKVMLAIGTDYEYFNAVWVKNEWSRFLKLIAKGEKKVLIPCYKDIDAYDMPKEFKNLQAQDMCKLGFMQDLVRGVCKILGVGEKKEAVVEKTVVKETVVSESASKASSLLERAFIFLEDEEWESADEYFEKVLDLEPKNAVAYLGKLCAELKVKRRDELCNCAEPFDDKNNYHKAIRFGNAKLREGLEKDNEKIRERNRLKQLENFYKNACRSMDFAKTEEDYKKAADVFKNIIEFKDSNVKERICLEKAEEARKEEIYFKACSFKKQKNIKSYEDAILHFEQISGFKDSAEQIAFCRDEIEKTKSLLEKAEIEKEKRRKKNKNIATIAISTVAFVMAAVVVFTTVIQPMMNYNAAVSLFEGGKTREALMIFGGMHGYKEADSYFAQLVEKYTLSAGGNHTVAIKTNGTVVSAGSNFSKQRNVSGWTDIISVAAGSSHTVGLKADGTVVAVGGNSMGQCEVTEWTNIIAIAAGSNHTVGVKIDGAVVAVGSEASGQARVSDWKDIIAVSAGANHTVGLKADGTVVTVGRNTYGQCDVSGWEDIIAVAAGTNHTVALKSDGTVVAVGDNEYGQCDVSAWTDIVVVAAGDDFTVGLKADGTVVAVGQNGSKQCKVSKWEDIVAITAGISHTVGLKADGTVVATGSNVSGQCNVSDWTDIKVPEVEW